MILNAYNFFMPKRDNDIHGTLFTTLTMAGSKDFLPNNPEGNKVQLATDGFNIICRSKLKPSGKFKSIEETIEFDEGSVIRGIVTLSNYKSCAFTKADLESFIAQHNRKPKYSETHPYRFLNDEEFTEYYVKLFEKNGMHITRHFSAPNPAGSLKMEKAKKYLRANDITFEAKILDVELFKNAWLNGIGRSKTYGFGLIRAQVVG